MRFRKRAPRIVNLHCDYCDGRTKHELDVVVDDDGNLCSRRCCLECPAISAQ
jgi:hypothetical protein